MIVAEGEKDDVGNKQQQQDGCFAERVAGARVARALSFLKGTLFFLKGTLLLTTRGLRRRWEKREHPQPFRLRFSSVLLHATFYAVRFLF